MYAPLNFIETNSHPMRIQNAPKDIQNKISDTFNKEMLALPLDKLMLYDTILNNRCDLNALGLEQEQLIEYIKEAMILGDNIIKTSQIKVGPGHDRFELTSDIFQFGFKLHLIDIWSKNKLVYKIDSELMNSLLNTELPKKSDTSFLLRLPSRCFYVDFNGMEPFIENGVGCFILLEQVYDAVLIKVILLVESEKPDHPEIMHLISEMIAGLNDDGEPIETDFNCKEMIKITLEDGTRIKFKNSAMFKFVHNFLMYLNAANRDVEVSERTKQIYRKPKTGSIPKNKMSEINEYDVGLKYGQDLRTKRTKVIYVNEEGTGLNTKGSPKSSHYRSAHWHSYWVGTGEDKHKELKWVEGIFVHGGTSDIVIHRAKI